MMPVLAPLLRPAAAVLTAIARVQDRSNAGQRLPPCPGQQRVSGLSAILAREGHAGCDQAGHQWRRERRAAPARHAVEVAYLINFRWLTADVGPGRKGIDQTLAGGVNVNPRAEVAEIRASPPIGAQRSHPDHLRKRRGPERLALGVVSGCSDHDDAFVMAVSVPEALETAYFIENMTRTNYVATV